ncbi:MAG: sigma-54 dependent transcriptional regulator [Smithellaceae bacterium]|jgi:DNA-binding NtrC family response regulator|nr:sigma-54 dependent transcriptional regulator [Smithellaceae bacterium]
MHKILIVDDEINLRFVLSAMLKKEGYAVVSAADGLEALQILKTDRIDVVVTDLKMPRLDGMGLLNRITEKFPEVPVIIITAYGTVATAVEALKKGALDYITKPFELDDLKHVISKAVKTRTLKESELFLPPEEIERTGIIGASKAMLKIFDAIKRVASTTTTILITGETGTGKELVADAIHYNSPRRSNPMIKINCAAIAPTLFESELFGHEKGSFTGATITKPGKLEIAHKGTLLLDEVGEIPREMQVKLLRVIQNQEFERVGGLRSIKVDVRIIAATNKNLLQDVRDGNFREDLYYRLNVFPIVVPPLRERREDILPLVDYFVDKFNKKLDSAITVDGEVKEMLSRYEWPGNIRELENLMERMMLMAGGKRITVSEIPAEVMGRIENSVASSGKEDKKLFKDFLRSHMEDVERQMIVRCLEESGSNVTKAAKMMGLSRKGLQIKMIKYNLRK